MRQTKLKARTTVMLTLALAVLAACQPSPDMPMYEQSKDAQRVGIQNDQRVIVTRIGVFKDDLAYEDRRGVYVITDNNTGKEFIGISGIGITETGSHNCGKNCNRLDER